MTEIRWVGPVAGALSVLLTLVAFGIAGEGPDFIGDKAEIVEYYTDDPGMLIASGVIDMVATLLLVVFAAAIYSRMRTAGATRLGSAAAFGGAVAMAAMFHLFDVVNLAAAFRADEDGGINPDVAASLSDLGFVALGVAATNFAALWVAATGVAGLRTGALPAWLCWVSLVLAAGLLIAPIAFMFLLGLLVWVLAVSVILWTQPTPAGKAVPAPGGPPSG